MGWKNNREETSKIVSDRREDLKGPREGLRVGIRRGDYFRNVQIRTKLQSRKRAN